MQLVRAAAILPGKPALDTKNMDGFWEADGGKQPVVSYERNASTMVKQIEHEVAYYYDSHPTKEDVMSETGVHRELIDYLKQVLTWLFWGQVCTICANLNFYQTANENEYPLVPDIAVIKGVDIDVSSLRNWRVGITGPAPHVVLEIASKETWKKDMKQKPKMYAQMGVAEYFLYDPNVPPLSPETAQRLFGWQLSEGVRELQVDSDGWMWSSQLESFLVPEKKYLRLYDRYGQQRLIRADAEAQARQVATSRAQIEVLRAEVEAQARRAETKRADAAAKRAEMEAEARKAEAKRADDESKRAEMEVAAKQAETMRADTEAKRAAMEAEARKAETMRADTEAKRAEMEAQARRVEAKRADAESKRADDLAEKLRSVGIDPDQL